MRRRKSRKQLIEEIKTVRGMLKHMEYLNEHTGLICAVHAHSACRQQIQGGVYKWMPYCNYRLRHDCQMVRR